MFIKVINLKTHDTMSHMVGFLTFCCKYLLLLFNYLSTNYQFTSNDFLLECEPWPLCAA